MDVNSDFDQRVVLHTEEIPWESSPMAGVARRRLDRVCGDNERVTTVVRYAPGSSFSSHVHTGGEEFIVLEGIFEDDYGNWPAGSYIRNPPQSSHTPSSKLGCVIMVKLGQFHPDDRTFVHAHIDKLGAVKDADRPNVKVSPLYRDAREEVSVELWQAGTVVPLDTVGGVEVFVLEGEFTEDADTLQRHSWLRLPSGEAVNVTAGPAGARVWIKRGHLLNL